MPRAYLVDLNIQMGREEFETPVRLYEFLKVRGRIGRFYFMTARQFSEKDQKEFQKKMKVEVIDKSDYERIHEVIEELMEES